MTRGRVVAIAVVALVLVGLAGIALRHRNRVAGAAGEEVQTAQVEPADFDVTVRLSGYLDAVRFSPIVAQVGQTGRGFRGSGSRIVSQLDDGSRVKDGDVIMRLDAAEAEEAVSDLEAELSDAEEGIRTARDDGQKRVQNARAALTKAEETLDLARTESLAEIERARSEVAYQQKELEVAQGQLDRRRRLAEERLMPLAEVESAEDEVRQRKLSLETAKRALTRAENEATVVEGLRKMDIENAQIQLRQAEAGFAQSVTEATRNLEATRIRLEEARAQLEGTKVKAPTAGLLLLNRNWRGEPLRVGDEVGEGQRVANIVDPAEMWVRADISEAEIEQVAVGQHAMVIVSALDASYPGRVEAIDNLARERGWWEGGVAGKKVFSALIRLEQSDDRLRPGMGAVADVRLRHVDEGLAVPVEALFEREGEAVVYREENGLYEPVTVQVGERNELLAMVMGGLEEGDVVACERPPQKLTKRSEELS